MDEIQMASIIMIGVVFVSMAIEIYVWTKKLKEDKMNKDERLFWVWHEDRISQEKGFKRDSPSQPEYNGQMWWFPSLGWTLWKETHCFDSKREAVDYAQKDVMNRITVLQKLLITLEKQLLEG